MAKNLSEAEVALLSKKLPLDIRTGMAKTVSAKYTTKTLSDKERRIAEEIFTIIAQDAEVSVRRTLSEQLKLSPNIPHDLALKMAEDVAEVATPMLQFSTVLSDEDLIHIIETSKDVASRIAIAQRDGVSETISDKLVDKGEAEVVSALVNNDTANISHDTIERVVEAFEKETSVLEGLVNRGGLSPAIAERLITRVSHDLKKSLANQYDISPYLLEDASRDSREWATLKMMHPTANIDLTELIENLYSEKRLTPSMVMRSLCIGNLRFYSLAMAKLADIPPENAEKLLTDQGKLGFRALYKAAGMPAGICDAVKMVFQLAWEETGRGKKWDDHYQNRMVERIVSEGYDRSIDNMPFLMAIIGRNITVRGKIH